MVRRRRRGGADGGDLDRGGSPRYKGHMRSYPLCRSMNRDGVHGLRTIQNIQTTHVTTRFDIGRYHNIGWLYQSTHHIEYGRFAL